jgi:hypothetical protein
MSIPTEQQMRFYNLMSGNEKIGKNCSGNFALDAVAGSGKTTSAVKGAECAKKRFRKIGFTAFNKTIADELQKRLGDNASASTLHALGRSILLSRFPFWELDKLKYNKLVKQNYPSFFKSTKGFGFLKPEFGSIFAVIDVVRSQNVDFSKLTGDTVSEISELCDRQGIELPSKDFIYELLGAAVRVCEIGSDPTVNTSFDFTDMVWLPNVLDIGKNMFDLLMADEAQDFNPIQQQLVYRVSEKVVIIGDPHQSIMGWAGADTNSFRNMVDELNATKLPLSVCWRCPKSHIELAKILVPHIQASPSAGDGLVEEIDPYQIPRVLKPGDMGICRNNAPLVSAAYRFMKDRVPVIVRGKDIGDSILSLIDKLDPLDLTDLSVRLKRWEERECKKLVDREADESAFESLRDRVDCVRELAGETDTLGDFRLLVSELFSNKEDKDCVILSSVHRSKGLEAENIAILNSDLLCKRAKDSEAYKQEKNLAYVALTRAKSKLLISGLGCSSPTEWVERMASGASQFIFGRRRSNV